MQIQFAHNFIINHCEGSPRIWRQITEFSVCPHSKKLPPLSSSSLLLKAGQTSDSTFTILCEIFCRGFCGKNVSLKGASNWVSIHSSNQTKLPLSFHFLYTAKALAKFFARVFAVSKKRAVKLRSPTATETRQLGFVKHLSLHDFMIIWQFLSQEHENL